MITKYHEDNIVRLFAQGHNVAHGCNCFHLMGGGVAKQLADYYPTISKVDKLTNLGDFAKLGTYSIAYGVKANLCFNLYTQYESGPNLSYSALVKCLENLNEWGKMKIVIPTVYMPRIGCGIAGGDWEKVKVLIDMFTPNVNIVIVDWDGSDF